MAKSEFELHTEPVTQLIGQEHTGMMLKVRRARLKVIKGPDKGLEKSVPAHGLIAGTSPSCDFVLTDSAISSEHFRLIPADLGFRIQDLGSRNGTWLHGVRLSDGYVDRPEKINVGYSTLRLEMLDGHQEYPVSGNTCFGAMQGQSVAMRQVFAMLERAANSEATLLLEGESGTGKDMAAETVHASSGRRNGPFIVVDCGGMQANLVESHLFGHRKGAFTGAISDQIGAFEAAHGGTVFLDEMGDLDPALQPKLLRVLEKKQVQRLGETVYRPIDVRLIAATNRYLESEMKAGRFRQDLFYRLSVLRVHLPALRDRREDIAGLAFSIVRQLRQDIDPHDVLPDDVLALLNSHAWPGNVREMRNVIERLLVFPEWPEHAIHPGSQESESAAAAETVDLPFHDARNLVLNRFEREYLISVLDNCGGVVAHAAKKADIPRQTFHRLMNKHGISKSDIQ